MELKILGLDQERKLTQNIVTFTLCCLIRILQIRPFQLTEEQNLLLSQHSKLRQLQKNEKPHKYSNLMKINLEFMTS